MPSEDYQFYDLMFHDLDRSDFVEEEEFIEEFTEAYETYRGKVALEMRRSKTQNSPSRYYCDPSAQIGGYTLFPQADPRESSTDFEGLDGPLDTILLKISLPEDVFLFYIQRSDLIRQDFSRVFYGCS
jgi:uncharacterized protein YwqG